MATKAAHKRLTREYATISQNPPPYILAHPSEANILEWHYVLTGPPDTPYEGGQYWGSLMFPSDYPFSPPAIRMHTPSGRFRCNERLCLSISDFHPKSFNPAWEVSTILLGVLSFMTSEEMTTGSVSGTPAERKRLAAMTRWDNSTGHGSTTRKLQSQESPDSSQQASQQQNSNSRGFGAIRKNAGGQAFREQWPELDMENWKWMNEQQIDPQSGRSSLLQSPLALENDADGERSRKLPGNVGVDGKGQIPGETSWVSRNRWYLAIAALFVYVIAARVVGT